MFVYILKCIYSKIKELNKSSTVLNVYLTIE